MSPRSAGLSAVLFSTLSVADDGWMGNGGSPSIFHGKHSSVRMVDEVVKIHVGEKFTTVDCLFHFANEGPATSLKMGFPDDDSMRGEDNKYKTVFRSFQSWVDGKSTKCNFEKSKENDYWQTKVVTFAKNQRRTVQDHYVVRTGSGDEGYATYLHSARYILHTGGSWKGVIDRAEVIFTFDPKFVRPTLLAPVPDESYEAHSDVKKVKAMKDFHRKNKGVVVYRGKNIPTLKNGQVSFLLKRINPTKQDNICLYFGPFWPSESSKT